MHMTNSQTQPIRTLENSPANHVLDKFKACGLKTQDIAKLLGIAPAGVNRFNCTKENHGTGGDVPAKHQVTLMRAAPDHGIVLDLDDFKWPDERKT